jgi:flagellar hook-basal body complex protein FliE
MDGMTIKNAQKFLESGRINSSADQKSMQINKGGSTGASDIEGGGSFMETLKTAINKVNEVQMEADVKAQQLATGKTDNVAEVMIATEKADIALKLMMQVRNKIIDAYQEIMKMQV